MRQRPRRRSSARRRHSLPVLYDVLFQIASMRNSVAELRADLAPCDAERFLTTLAIMEGTALHLLDVAYQRGEPLSH